MTKRAYLEYATNEEHSHFVGFHDICPWNVQDKFLAVHSTTNDLIKKRSIGDFINICLINPDSKEIRIIDRTNTWNWQQGSRLQWIPNTNSIIYNTRTADKVVSKIYNTEKETFEEFICSIYCISSDGKYGITYNFERMHKYWDAYGYAYDTEPFNINITTPDDDGLFLINFETGKVSLLVSLHQTANFENSKDINLARFHTHASFSPNGEKICFFERFHTKEGALYSRFFVINRDGTGLKLISEGKQSHFDWSDDNTILIWSRPSASAINKLHKTGILSLPLFKQAIRMVRKLSPGIKSSMTNEHFKLVNILENKETSLGKGLITEDGHPMFSPNREWFVNDTYPNKEGMQTLMLFNMRKGSRINIQKLYSPEPFWDLGLKCDLHPRWNRKGNKICVDTTVSGKRQVHIYNVEQIISEFK